MQAAAAVEVLWRAHYIVTRQRIDAAVDESASGNTLRADDAPRLLLGVMTSAQVLSAPPVLPPCLFTECRGAQRFWG